MLNLVVENSFDKDYKKEIKNGLDENLLLKIVNKLQKQETLEPKYKDQKLKGEYKDLRECHIKPDLFLIYQAKEQSLHLVRLGSHSQLF